MIIITMRVSLKMSRFNSNNRDFKIRGRQLQRRRERQRTIVLINENKRCTLECSVLTACLYAAESSLLGLCGQRERQTTKCDNLCLPSRLNLLPFSVRESRTTSKGKIYR